MTFSDDFVTIHHGDCLDVMRGMEPNSVDAIVTDPPYGLGFMGRDWDHGVPGEHFWREALRVAKPGCHLVAFGGTRTYHRLAVAIEDAGWEIRDGLGWLYGSGFPKSLDVSKAIDKATGAEREVVGVSDRIHSRGANTAFPKRPGESEQACEQTAERGNTITAPATEAAAKWGGWGTALKPAWEPIILARKPLGSAVAQCVQTWGTGALNIDGCRVEASPADIDTMRERSHPNGTHGGAGGGSVLMQMDKPDGFEPNAQGRWPANIVHDGSDEVLAVFPQSDGQLVDASQDPNRRTTQNCYGTFANGRAGEPSADKRYTDEGATDFAPLPGQRRGDAGSAARFFYTAKATTAERDEGLHGFAETRESDRVKDDGPGGDNPRNRTNSPRKNSHPTVKPLALMRWLVRLVTPPGGIVLDPFMGSGTTLKAARAEGFKSIGVDLEREHCEIAWGRLSQGVLL